jgi:hypothetical protein
MGASCGDDAIDAPAATVSSTAGVTVTAPIDDIATVDSLLEPHGLRVDRILTLPRTDATAFVVQIGGGDEAIAAWRAAHELVPKSGRYPVIVTAQVLDPEGWEASVGTPSGAIAEAGTIDVDAWFDQRFGAMGITATELEAEPPLPAYQFDKHEFASLEWNPEVELLLLPTADGWEAPAFLLWGGWNDTPFPEEHVALMRRWHQQYGAEPVMISLDVIEMTVSRPPHDADAAIVLAREHFIYAPDVVWQGVGELGVLASAVLDASVWFFWFD